MVSLWYLRVCGETGKSALQGGVSGDVLVRGTLALSRNMMQFYVLSRYGIGARHCLTSVGLVSRSQQGTR